MCLDESVTRKGEGGADYCRDPKAKRGQGELVHIHWLETPIYVRDAGENTISKVELKFNTTAYVLNLEYFRF
jgi:hypothetical protein